MDDAAIMKQALKIRLISILIAIPSIPLFYHAFKTNNIYLGMIVIASFTIISYILETKAIKIEKPMLTDKGYKIKVNFNLVLYVILTLIQIFILLKGGF